VEELSSDLLDSLIVDITNRCRAVGERSALLSHLEFASENPKKLAKLIGDISYQLPDHLVVLRHKYQRDPANVLNDIRIIDDFVRELAANLRYVDGAVATKLPWSLPQPLENLAKRILPGTNLMLRPQWKYNYSILIPDLGEGYREELRRILPQNTVDTIFTNFPTEFHIISFPSVERGTVLLHCDLAHEIGHLVARKFIEYEEETSSYLVDLQRRIAKQVKTESSKDKSARESIEESLELAISVRSFGLAEIISDIFAMRLLGPAALFALLQMAMGDSLDLQPNEETSFYPPWRTRLRHALRSLEKTDLLPVRTASDKSKTDSKRICKNVQNRIEQIRELTEQRSDAKVLASDGVVRLAYDSIDTTIPEVEDFLTENYGTTFLTPQQLYPDVYHLVQRLSANIPPNAIESASFKSRPAGLEVILNAAWFFRISELKNAFADGVLSENFLREYRILNRLTFKAIEFSHVQQLYKQWDLTQT
jgi:hypothetical protein